jgi:hypothetical protein
LNTKSSTETEIVGLFDKTSDTLWTHNFLEAQGYTISANYVYQDNMSTLSLATNGHVLNSKRTKHIKAKYFSSNTIIIPAKLISNIAPLMICGLML